MNKIKLGFIFGGPSTESDISLCSASDILKELDKEKYEIFPIYIGKNGKWYKYLETKKLQLGEEVKKKEELENVFKYLQDLDVIFPLLHGLNGEDGSIQGLLQLINKPYVGSGILASALGMDKAYAKIIFEKAGFKQTKYEYIRKYKEKYFYINKKLEQELLDIDDILIKIKKNLKFPLFVKPSNSGSSIGITKVTKEEYLKSAIENAEKFDSKILIEEGVDGKEVVCAVLGNEEIVASGVGEIQYLEEFYTFSAKYLNPMENILKADISNDLVEKVRAQAIKAYKAIDGKGLSRVDFFIDKKTNDIIINEINTMPGFTRSSWYAKLFKAYGISYKDLMNKIIDLAIENHKKNF